MTSRIGQAWRRAQHGWPARYPLVQFPNAPLIAAIGGRAAAEGTDGPLRAAALAASYAGLGVWAWWELTAGTNAVRRVYGAGGLALVAAMGPREVFAAATPGRDH